MWDEEDNNPYGAFNQDDSGAHDNPALSSSCKKVAGREKA